MDRLLKKQLLLDRLDQLDRLLKKQLLLDQLDLLLKKQLLLVRLDHLSQSPSIPLRLLHTLNRLRHHYPLKLLRYQLDGQLSKLFWVHSLHLLYHW